MNHLKLRALADDLADLLGPNFKMFRNDAGDLRFRSNNGDLQIRFDLKDFHGTKGPHINIDIFQPRNLYPGDRNMIQIPHPNDHIFLGY